MVSSVDGLFVGTTLVGKTGSIEADNMQVEEAFPFSPNIPLRKC